MAVDLEATENHLWGIATRLKWTPISGEAKQQRDIDTCWMRDKLFEALEDLSAARAEIAESRASVKCKEELFKPIPQVQDILQRAADRIGCNCTDPECKEKYHHLIRDYRP